MGRRTDFMGRQSFLFGFQSAREVLFLPEVSLSISLLFFFFFFFLSMYLFLAALGLAASGTFVQSMGFSLLVVCRLQSARASVVA